MEGVREYLLSVTAGAILCGILGSLVGENGAFSGLYKLISGLVLCFLMISPLVNIELSDFTEFSGDLLAQGNEAVMEGEEKREEMLRQIITDEARAYIMDKARSYGAEIQVEITLSRDDPPVPEGCTIQGQISPYVKQQLKKILITDLGIPEENHLWIR